MSWFLLIGLMAVGVCWYFRREPDPLVTPLLAPNRPLKSRYRAVRLAAAAACCPAAERLGRRRFLLTEAPRLPLEHCNRIIRCRCRYKHYADRRSGDDRRQIFGSLAYDAPGGTADRRSGQDRRRGKPAEYDYLNY